MAAVAENTFGDYSYYIEKHEVEFDNEDDYKYEEVPEEDDTFGIDVEDDLEGALKAVKEAAEEEKLAFKKEEELKPRVNFRPESTDDYVRNFLARVRMFKTLDIFQNEWYEKQEKGELSRVEIGQVPDVYLENKRLLKDSYRLTEEVENCKKAALAARDLCVKMRKERDYHRLEHRRLANEKNKLINDIKRLKNHYSQYEPMLDRLKQKYESAMKEKILTKIDRDRALGELTGLKSTLKQMEQGAKGEDVADSTAITGYKSIHECEAGHCIPVNDRKMGPTQQSLARQRERANRLDTADMQYRDKNDPKIRGKQLPNDSQWPVDKQVNPYLAQIKELKTNLRGGGMRLTTTLELHDYPVACVAVHPSKMVAASASDDYTWKLFAVPSGDVLMIGEGHKQWIGGIHFHPDGSKLATGSGDNTVRIWDFEKSVCEHMFAEHQAPVWAVNYHWSGDFLASASDDETVKIWDLGSLRCRQTLYGHKSAVNSVEFLAYSNTMLTSSADMTLSLWDARSGMCAHTFFGHMHAVNAATFNQQGTLIASCDSFGDVKVWDVRKQLVINAFTVGTHSANDITFDPTGTILAVAANDGSLKIFELQSTRLSSLAGHQDAVQTVSFDRRGQYLLSGGSDGTVRVWT